MLARSALARDDRRGEVRHGVEQALQATGAGRQCSEVPLERLREGVVQAPEGARGELLVGGPVPLLHDPRQVAAGADAGFQCLDNEVVGLCTAKSRALVGKRSTYP